MNMFLPADIEVKNLRLGILQEDRVLHMTNVFGFYTNGEVVQVYHPA